MTDMPDITELTDDGSTVELEDGRILRLRRVFDEDASINDYEGDGKVSPSYSYLHGEARTPRPKGFTGRAVKIETDYGYWAWWQPSDDAVYETPDDFRKDKQRIADLVRFGFVGLIVELCEGTDAYGKLIVRKVASVYGLEWDVLQSEYRNEVVAELVSEVLERASHDETGESE